VKKPKAFYDHDYEEGVEAREDMMAARVRNNEATENNEARPGGQDKFYAASDNSLGDAGPRRRGPIPRRIK